MMIFSLHILSQFLVLFTLSSTGEPLDDFNLDDIIDNTTLTRNESFSTSPYSSVILTVLTTSEESASSSPSTISRKPAIGKSVVDQINEYRQKQIFARIEECDSTMKLNDICETYSIDNETNALIRRSDIDFLTFDDLFDSLVDRTIVEKLDQLCLSKNWCLGNLSENNSQFTNYIIKKHGSSFCSLEECQSRLTVFVDSCPTILNIDISITTLKLLPMLCTLYEDQLSWNSTECIEGIVYLFHMFYAFWPQFEKCNFAIIAGFNECTSDCQTFNNVLTKLEQQCNGNASFLSRVPALAWSRSINLKEICEENKLPKRPAFISSMKKFLSTNKIWHRLYKKPLYTIFSIVVIISLVISFSLYFYLKSKYRSNANNRRLGDDYEYTRLQNSSFELGPSSEIPNGNSTMNGFIDEESQMDSNDRFRSSEHQRLLFVNS